ncbi:MAG: hypothetical protein ACI9UK_001167 [Candidatus Krumholzibacteriia bacterium]|jgi:hypothetical protein
MILKFPPLAVAAPCALIFLPTSGIAQSSYTDDFAALVAPCVELFVFGAPLLMTFGALARSLTGEFIAA